MALPALQTILDGHNVALIRRLVGEQGRRHRTGYVVAVLCMVATAVTTSLSAWIMKDVINEVFIGKNGSAVFLVAGAVMAIYMVKGAATYGQQVVLSRIANAIIADVQRRLFGHLLEMDVAYVLARHTSEFVARQSFIANACGTILNTVVTAIGRDLLSVIGLLVVMVIQDPMLSVLGLGLMPLSVFGVQKLVKRAKKAMLAGYSGGMAVVENIQETILGFRQVKAFALEDHMRGRVDRAILDVERAANKLANVGARTSPMMETLGGLAVAAVILYGGWRVTSAGATPGTFFSFITALLLIYEPAKRLARVHVDLSSNLVGVNIFYDFMDEPARERDEGPRPPLAVDGGRIEFRDVRFAYRPEEEVLRGLDLTAEAGKTTALVGPSGGGKSTILALLLRFWEPSAGTITIDGQSIDAVERRSLRRHIALVSQDAFLFKGTVFENITLGRPGASRDEVIAAAQAAAAHDFITGFQNGYDTEIGENGTQLSGGQRQRLAIARAILKDAPILLLDEATAALDTESEQAIQKALDRLSRGRTTLVIAHRLQTIQRADTICVIEGGRVVESGRHDELLALDGRYRRLHDVQFGGGEAH
ncbi:ABC transporter ATP-binding protein [Siculibacillus lacustris]|uniref:ABC transporter ATP-binding protein n=1 Tax=Siculibacillus lacustris TaxID=1549641 RepID=A0A4Q9VWK9_9HYPH|nr:ABC transporter ATP-binding protein [Siculibacillus lacustris]TBW40715.1 ABC transporter ATP-binding protein [Siculibacillus lacustris]